MASPLPNTNAPAFVKNKAICVNNSWKEALAVGATANKVKGSNAAVVEDAFFHGEVRKTQANIPAPRNNQMLSDSVMMVTAALQRNRNQSKQL